MSRNGSITLTWADGEHVFRLAWGQLVELQEKCNAGPLVILQRLRTGEWMLDDVAEVIRLGLLGGGLKPVEAAKLVTRYVKERPPVENVETSFAILSVALIGAPDEDSGREKPDGEPIDGLANGKIRIAEIYGAGAAMGFTPQQINDMSLWQFMSAAEGYRKANDPEAGKELTAAEKDRLHDLVQSAT